MCHAHEPLANSVMLTPGLIAGRSRKQARVSDCFASRSTGIWLTSEAFLQNLWLHIGFGWSRDQASVRDNAENHTNCMKDLPSDRSDRPRFPRRGSTF